VDRAPGGPGIAWQAETAPAVTAIHARPVERDGQLCVPFVRMITVIVVRPIGLLRGRPEAVRYLPGLPYDKGMQRAFSC
jgi:hypothetical protein